ncbi:GRP family sugar transporter [Peribacillus butanolivorans]|uniref:GRP family sugar transporter n=1 Tax=Peribacillus butanolivorans TaxID=421767 RepID=UPI002E1F2D42|nr:GRP family sugar transporter [Peribacillus butanolivorans]MED3688358.1 GRP family sugar transporter [Peribacillus butanolivorans]
MGGREYRYPASNPKVGVSIAFSFSQMGIVISTLSGIFLLGREEIQKSNWLSSPLAVYWYFPEAS